MLDAIPQVSSHDEGRPYHIDLARGEVVDYILLPGDPDRTDRSASLLDNVEVKRRHREFNSVTGLHRGLRISVLARNTTHSGDCGWDKVRLSLSRR